MKKTAVFLSSLLGLAVVSHGQTDFTDDFNRQQDVAPTTNGTDIGPDWVIGDQTGGSNSPEWELIGSGTNDLDDIRVNQNTTNMVADSVMWNTTVSLAEGDFTVSSTTSQVTGARRSGISFFVQDADSFLAFRARSNDSDWQVVEVDNGSNTTVANGSLSSGTFDYSNSDYTLTVASSAADTFDLSIVEEATGNTVVDTSFTDSTLAFDSGFAGLYYQFETGQVRWDDISVTSPIPEPSSVALFLGGAGLFAVLLRRRRR